MSDLLTGSKKRNKRSNKTSSGFVCNADLDFISMHGRGISHPFHVMILGILNFFLVKRIGAEMSVPEKNKA